MPEITLESPFPIYAVPRVWIWMQQSMAGKFDDFAPKTQLEFVDDWIERRDAGRKTWAVIREGEIGGAIVSTRLSQVVADIHLVFKRSFWGHATTVPALAMACEELFKNGYPQGVEKIETVILPENRAALGMSAAVGFGREGLARGHTLRGGKPVDVVLVGLERGKFDVWNRRRLQQQEHIEPVSKPGQLRHEPQPAPGTGGVGSRHLRGAAPVHDEPAGRGQPGAHGGAESGQPELLGVG